MDTTELPTKSSTEILTELFGVFNAEPPLPESSTDDEETSKKDRKKSKKSKKSRKKSKKKHKKKSSSSSDSSSNEEERNGKLKRKLVTVNAVDSALDFLLENIKKPKLDPDSIPMPDDFILKSEPNIDLAGKIKVEIKVEKTENEVPYIPVAIKTEEGNHSSYEWEPEKNDDRERLAAVFAEPEAQNGSEADKRKTKPISIPNLANSSLFQETLRAVEEREKQEKERKSKYEDGEISPSSVSSDENEETLIGDKHKSEKSSRRKSSRSSRGEHRDRRDRRRSRSRESRRERSRHTSSYYGSRSDRHSRSSSRMLPNPSHRRRDSRDRHREREKTSLERRRERSISRDSHRSDRSKPKDDDRTHRHREVSTERRSERERSEDSNRIDKKKLLAIAKKNAVKLVEAGLVSASSLKSITSSGKTVNELTEYCKKLSKRDANDISDNESDNSDVSEDISFHHPFQVRDRPNSIVMNIRNAIALPVRSLQEKTAEQSKVLRLQYPVSSGSTHRANENEWVPVEPEPPKTVALLPPSKNIEAAALMPPPPPPLPLSAMPPPATPAPVFPSIQASIPTEVPPEEPVDISSIVTKRLDALRALQEDPDNRSAKVLVSRTERQLEQWVKTDSRKPRERKPESGAFTGSTGARLLTPQELASGSQAWAKRDQLMTARPVSGGMGMALLQKMGWNPGEGLGKNKEGSLEPLKLEVKTDKKGLVANDEASWGSKTPRHVGPAFPTVKTLDGKHPVSLLNEYCLRRKWGAPNFSLALECGPDHKKNFLFKVTVNGVEYKPTVASINKKQAKAEAAAICLRALGLITTNPT